MRTGSPSKDSRPRGRFSLLSNTGSSLVLHHHLEVNTAVYEGVTYKLNEVRFHRRSEHVFTVWRLGLFHAVRVSVHLSLDSAVHGSGFPLRRSVLIS